MSHQLARMLLAACLLLLAARPLSASAQNLAVVDADAILADMPDYKSVTLRLAEYQRNLAMGLSEQRNQMEQYYANTLAQAQAGALTPRQQQEAERHLTQLQEALEKRTEASERQLQKKQEELTRPVQIRFQTALERVADAQGYDFIVDKKFLLLSKGADATSLVRTELGISPGPSTPTAP